MELPLKGVRVLVIESFGAGPWGSMHLADMGAEVIKVESGAGDASRAMGPHFLGQGDSHYFQTMNLNKKSVRLDLKHPAGRAAFRRLAATADAVMNNLRGDQPEIFGITYAQLRDVNPQIVCTHLSAYGRDNERRGWPGYDYLMQAEAGFLFLSGEPGGPPTRMGLSIIDFMSGVTAAFAMVSALLGAARTGQGRDVDVCLFDVALHQLSYPATWYLNEGAETGRIARSAHPSAVPVQLYRTGDGWIFLMCMMDKFWDQLLAALERPDLGRDPRFASMADRRANRDALTEVLDQALSVASTADWLQKFQGRLPAAPVFKMGEALDSEFVHRIGMVRANPHPVRPDFRSLANPIKLDGRRVPSRPASALGADTDAVLHDAGFSPEEIAQLRGDGVL